MELLWLKRGLEEATELFEKLKSAQFPLTQNLSSRVKPKRGSFLTIEFHRYALQFGLAQTGSWLKPKSPSKLKNAELVPVLFSTPPTGKQKLFETETPCG